MGMAWGSRGWWRLAASLLWLAVGFAAPAAAQLVELEARGQPVPLGASGESWIDAGGTARVEDVAADRSIDWQPMQPHPVYRLAPGNALWVRFFLPPGAEADRWYLEVPYPSLNRITLYSRDVIGQWVPQTAGDRLPVAQWPIPHRHPLLPLVAPGGQPAPALEAVPYLVRIENGHTYAAPLQFVNDGHMNLTEQRISLLLGMYFGLVLLTALLSLAGAISLRDTVNGQYAATVLLMGLSQASLTGMGGLHLWPNSPRWNDVAPVVLPVLGVGALTWFFAGVVSLKERSRRFHAVLLALGALALPVAVALAWVDPADRFRLLVPYILVASHVGLGAVVWAALRGDRYAPWVLAGSAPVALSAAFPLAHTAGLLPLGFWTVHGMQVGIALELPLLLLLLLARSQHRREYQRRMQGLARIDPVTGLLNADVFHERLVRLIARSQRLKYRSAVLLVDIPNMEAIRRTFEAGSAQALSLHVAGRLLSVARDIDSVARLSDHRFGLLLEGPLHADEVAEAGPRVVARCLMPIPDKPLEVSAQVRVAQALVPMDGTDPHQLIGQLEILLASADPDGRRSVLMLSRPGVARAATS